MDEPLSKTKKCRGCYFFILQSVKGTSYFQVRVTCKIKIKAALVIFGHLISESDFMCMGNGHQSQTYIANLFIFNISPLKILGRTYYRGYRGIPVRHKNVQPLKMFKFCVTMNHKGKKAKF